MKLLILDRDGVINEDSDFYIKSASEWHLLPGSAEAIARFNQAGYHVAVATNQSGIGRGLFGVETLNLMHDKMHSLVIQAGGRIDAVFYCPHTPEMRCECRKPEPGMLFEIGRHFDFDLAGALFVGDSLSDMQAATKAKCKAILVKTGKGRRTIEKGGLPPDTSIFDDLAAVAAHYCE